MRGTIEVTGDPVEPTATPTATPTETAEPTITPRPTTTATPVPTVRPGEDRTTPAPTGSAALDRTAPAITKFSLKAVRRGATVRFTLSENAAVTIRFKKGSADAAHGAAVRARRLARGHGAWLEARDGALLGRDRGT